MGGGPSQSTNSVQSTNQNFNDLSNMVQNLSSNSISNLLSTGSTASSGTGVSSTTGTNQSATTGGNANTSAGTSQGAQTGQTAFQNNPWAPAIPQLTNILSSIGGIDMNLTPAQQAALAATSASAGSLPNFGNAATNAVSNMFGSMNGVPQAGLWGNAYGNYAGAMSPFTNLNNLNPMNTPGFSEALFDPVNGINAQIANNTKALFAGAGRDPAGNADASQAIARGESLADLPMLMSQYNTNVGNYMNAAGNTFGAAGNTATGMTNLLQTPIQNQIAGINNAGNVSGLWMNPAATQLGVANNAFGLPYANISIPQNMVQQIAGLGQQGTGQTSGQQTGATTGTSTGTNFSNTTGTNTSQTLTAQQQQQLQQQQQQQQLQKIAQGTSSGQQQGNQQGVSVGNSTTTGSSNPFATGAGIGLGLFSMFG